MEYFEDYDQVEFSNLGVLAAEAIGRALGRIHEARVGHGDIDGRNTLFVREAKSVRVVWTDFSSAWVHA
jgi:tRNA A-37 threonylcarbamoyl transferase component Bud32